MPTRVAIALATVLVAAPLATAHASGLRAPSKAVQGQSFKVPASKRGKAAYYLSRDTRRSIEDVRLIGPSKSKVIVPAAPAGNYRLLACSGTHCAASRGQVAVAEGTPTQIVAFSDSKKLEENDQFLASSNAWKPDLCPTPVASRRLPSLAGALDAAERLLARAAGPKGMAQFEASAAYRSAAAAEGAAVEAVALKEPGAALAALLRAHELQPEEPRYLVGAAAILTSLDHPAEALALIQGADRMTPSGSAPFGINVQALALNAKGAALLALGQFEEAERYLRAALEIEPLLAEAKVNLSIALMCRQKQPEGMRFLRAGLQRQATINPDGTIALPNLADQLDLTHGKQLTLPTIPLPGSFREAQGSWPLYVAHNKASSARLTARSQRDSALLQESHAHPDSLLTQRRALDIAILAWPPEMRAAEDVLLKLDAEVHGKVLNLTEDLQRQRTDWNKAASIACAEIYTNPQRQQCMDRVYNEHCPAPLERAHQQVVDWVRAQEKADREYLERYYPYATAVLANISNPVTQERWLISTEEKVDGFWFEPFDTLTWWTFFAKDERCMQSPGSYDAPVEAPTTPRPDPCPPEVRGVKLAWKLEAVSVEVNCEKVSVEASAAVQGWIGVFGQLDWSPRSGKITIFGGPKLSAKIPGTGIGGSFKDGLYLQFGKDGNVGDFGFRTSVSGTAGFGPFAIKGSDSMDFSFAPVFGIAR
jgi:tetratricopeptide (TPR) repeat protein